MPNPIKLLKKWHNFLCFVLIQAIIFHAIALLTGFEKISIIILYFLSLVGGIPLVYQMAKKYCQVISRPI